MCTVSFVAYRAQVYLTSNRDEKQTRARAVPPAPQHTTSGTLLFPRDPVAGGTWIAVKDTGDAAVLLNGALYPHQPAPPYRQSRGLVILHILKREDPNAFLLQYNCTGIEPFTLILFTRKQLYEYRWDGVEKSVTHLDATKSYLWSSATLYSPEVMGKRKRWFDEWLINNPEPTQQEITRFHRFAGDGDAANDLFMNRNNETYTSSISSIAINENGIKMNYWDALENTGFISEPGSYSNVV